MDEWRKFISSLGIPPIDPPHRTNIKYVFNKSSKGVFVSGRYVGQGVLKENTLYVTQYQAVDINHFTPNTHLN